MDALDAEYSFLAPTWKLPAVATTSMYAGTYSAPYPEPASRSDPDWVSDNERFLLISLRFRWQGIIRYATPVTFLRRNPVGISQRSEDVPCRWNLVIHRGGIRRENRKNRMIISKLLSHLRSITTSTSISLLLHLLRHLNRNKNAFKSSITIIVNLLRPIINRVETVPIPILLVVLHPHATQFHRNPNTCLNTREKIISRTLHTPVEHVRPTRRSTNLSAVSVQLIQVSENHRHEGDSGGNEKEFFSFFTGSYVNAHKDQQRRSQNFKEKHKTVLHDYKNFALNGGFGPSFGSAENQTHKEKVRSFWFSSTTWRRLLFVVARHRTEEKILLESRSRNESIQNRRAETSPEQRWPRTATPGGRIVGKISTGRGSLVVRDVRHCFFC